MRSLTRLWSALEACPALAAPLAEWRDHLADEFDGIGPLLRPTDDPATTWPCPSPGGDGCPRRVIDHGDDDTLVAVCGERPMRCDRITLSRADTIIYELDRRALCLLIARTLRLDPGFSEFVNYRGTWRVGEYAPLSGEHFPVYLSLPDGPDQVYAGAVRLAGIAERPFILLVPTRSLVEPATLELLGRSKSRVLALEHAVALDARGQWMAQRAPADLFREFRTGVLGEDGPTVPSVRFPTPPGARWEEVSIRFLTQHQVHVRVRGATGTYEHTQMAMASRRNDQPTKQWELLQRFAEHRGELTWSDSGADPKNEKRRQLLAKQLREFFGIDGDPFGKLSGGRGWRTRFTVIPEA